MKHRYTEEQLRYAISISTSIRQALITLGITGEGGNYRVIHRAIKLYKIDTSHFTGQSWSKNKSLSPKHPTEKYLVKGSSIGSFQLKKRLLKEGYFEHFCSQCHLSTWLDSPIPLELDHIDGKHDNNKLSNLRLLCPNCHALTPTYRGKNKLRLARDCQRIAS